MTLSLWSAELLVVANVELLPAKTFSCEGTCVLEQRNEQLSVVAGGWPNYIVYALMWPEVGQRARGRAWRGPCSLRMNHIGPGCGDVAVAE